MLGNLVTANCITVTTDSETSILSIEVKAVIICLLSQSVHSKMPMLPSEETLLMTGYCEEV